MSRAIICAWGFSWKWFYGLEFLIDLMGVWRSRKRPGWRLHQPGSNLSLPVSPSGTSRRTTYRSLPSYPSTLLFRSAYCAGFDPVLPVFGPVGRMEVSCLVPARSLASLTMAGSIPVSRFRSVFPAADPVPNCPGNSQFPERWTATCFSSTISAATASGSLRRTST